MNKLKKFENFGEGEEEELAMHKWRNDRHKQDLEYEKELNIVDEDEVALRNNLIEAARLYVVKYGRDKLEEVLTILIPY